MAEALQIYQTVVDKITQALWNLDHDALLANLTMPNLMQTQDAEILLDTPEKLRTAAEDFRTYLRNVGAQDYVRLARWAEFDPSDPDRIMGRHETMILRGGNYLVQPFQNEMFLVRQDGVWRGTEIRASVKNCICTIISPAQLRKLRLERDEQNKELLK